MRAHHPSALRLAALLSVTYLLLQCRAERLRLAVSPISLGTIKPVPMALRFPLSLPLPVTVQTKPVVNRKKPLAKAGQARPVAIKPPTTGNRVGETPKLQVATTSPVKSRRSPLNWPELQGFVTTYKGGGYLGGPENNRNGKRETVPIVTSIPQSMTTTYTAKGYLNAAAVNPLSAQHGGPTPEPAFLVATDWAFCLSRQPALSGTDLYQLAADTATRHQPFPGVYTLVAAFLQPGLPDQRATTSVPVNVADATTRHLPVQPVNLPRRYAVPADSTPVRQPVPSLAPARQAPTARKKIAQQALLRTPLQPIPKRNTARPVEAQPRTTVHIITQSVPKPIPNRPCTELLQRFLDVGGCPVFSMSIHPDMRVKVTGCHPTMAYLLMGMPSSKLVITPTGAYQSQEEQGQITKLPIGIWVRADSLWLCRSVQIGATQQKLLTLLIRRTTRGPSLPMQSRRLSLWHRLTGWFRKHHDLR